METALWAKAAGTPMHAGNPTVGEPTQRRVVPSALPLTLSELQRARSPLQRSEFEHELANYPDKTFVNWLLHSIDNGVSLGYSGPRTSHISPNLFSARLHPMVIEELTKEINKGRILGPFNDKPLPNLRCSGMGVVPKKNGGWRVIMHLSAPPGSSVNDHISSEDFTLHYTTIDDAVQLISSHAPGAMLAKVDLKSAFRMVPVRRQDWELLGLHWDNHYFVDTCLPFGCRSSPFLFNQFATTLHWILTNNYKLQLIHYLDDFFIVGEPQSDQCATAVRTMLRTCNNLGIPVAMEKLEGPATTITFLGIEIDSAAHQLRLPESKLSELQAELITWHKRKKCTKRQLLSLIGKLSFATKVIPAGRLFFRRLIDLSKKKKRLHHHITLNKEARADIHWWLTFLPSWNGIAMFVEHTWTDADTLELYTDASGRLGLGAYWAGEWIRGDWLPHQRRSIQWQELFAIVAAVTTWQSKLRTKQVRFFCDNEPIVKA